MREAIYSLALDRFSHDERVRACWLWGPLANYILTPYQEVVMAVAIEAESYAGYVDRLEEQVRSMSPVIALRKEPGNPETGAGITLWAVFEGGVLFKLAVHRADRLCPQPGPVVVLFKRNIELELAGPHLDHGALRETAAQFWMIALEAIEELAREDAWAVLDSLHQARHALWRCWKLAHGSVSPARFSLLDSVAPDEQLQERLRDTIPTSMDESALTHALDNLIGLGDAELPRLLEANQVQHSPALAKTVREVFAVECGTPE